LLQKSLVLRTVDLQPGDGLLLYTDGLVEALDPAAHRLGGKAVLEELRGAGRASVHEIIAALRRRVDAHRRGRAESDDLTMLVVQRLGVAASVAAGRAARVGIEVKR
jgi:sigma-B regulation protein RsbU (phosphoserine phosphatase)